ncbi:MAG: hypothetical protein NUV35_00280, partial [Syntrophomonadaceae bacterium]|nr:hypothetical protein [Syntrophomonadaceae bacterium]
MATYLVGGAVRDLLLGHPPRDWDVITSGDPDRLAEELSRGTGGVFFVMDEDNQVYRVVLPHGHVVIDVAGIKGSLEEDLQRRDFTINAMAVPIATEELLSAVAGRPLRLRPDAVIDPFGGQEDLARGVVRALGLEVLEADPVRTLRAVRMAAAKEFVIEPCTVNWIGLTSHLLRQVAGERIRDELFAILARPRSAQYLRQLVQLGLWREMVPDAAAAGWQQGMAWVERLEDMEAEEFAPLGEWAPVSALRLRQATVYPRTRLQLLKLVAALGVTGAAGTQAASALGEQLSLGREERNLLARLPELAPAAAALVQAPEPSCPELY